MKIKVLVWSFSLLLACYPFIFFPRILKISRLPISSFSQTGSIFATGSPLLIRGLSRQRKVASKATPVSIKCEQSSQGSSVDVWLGRFAMIGFAVTIIVEISTDKGLLENFGLISPLPTVALAVTALVGEYQGAYMVHAWQSFCIAI